jgi:hypothetical protein
MGGVCNMYEGDRKINKPTNILSENRKEIDHLEILGVYGRIILKWLLKRNRA